MSTTRKHDHFLQFPMGDNPVTILPGIGYGNKKGLRREGYFKVLGCPVCIFQSKQKRPK